MPLSLENKSKLPFLTRKTAGEQVIGGGPYCPPLSPGPRTASFSSCWGRPPWGCPLAGLSWGWLLTSTDVLCYLFFFFNKMINNERVGFGGETLSTANEYGKSLVRNSVLWNFFFCNPWRAALLTARKPCIRILGLVPAVPRVDRGRGGKGRVPIWVYIVVTSHRGPFPFLFERTVRYHAGGSVVQVVVAAVCWFHMGLPQLVSILICLTA